jgi:hypothetical protein
MHTVLGTSVSAETIAADERWAAWVARGKVHDKRTRKRAIAAAAVVASALAIWLGVVLLLG